MANSSRLSEEMRRQSQLDGRRAVRVGRSLALYMRLTVPDREVWLVFMICQISIALMLLEIAYTSYDE